jgi:hypothetical protein
MQQGGPRPLAALLAALAASVALLPGGAVERSPPNESAVTGCRSSGDVATTPLVERDAPLEPVGEHKERPQPPLLAGASWQCGSNSALFALRVGELWARTLLPHIVGPLAP